MCTWFERNDISLVLGSMTTKQITIYLDQKSAVLFFLNKISLRIFNLLEHISVVVAVVIIDWNWKRFDFTFTGMMENYSKRKSQNQYHMQSCCDAEQSPSLANWIGVTDDDVDERRQCWLYNIWMGCDVLQCLMQSCLQWYNS